MMGRWWDRSSRTVEDERAVAELRVKMERIMSQLEKTIEEMRRALEDEEDCAPPVNGNGNGGRGSVYPRSE
jgi:hypothetical protein